MVSSSEEEDHLHNSDDDDTQLLDFIPDEFPDRLGPRIDGHIDCFPSCSVADLPDSKLRVKVGFDIDSLGFTGTDLLTCAFDLLGNDLSYVTFKSLLTRTSNMESSRIQLRCDTRDNSQLNMAPSKFGKKPKFAQLEHFRNVNLFTITKNATFYVNLCLVHNERFPKEPMFTDLQMGVVCAALNMAR